MENVQKALELWTELTGVDPNAKSLKLGLWGIQSLNSELKESITLDTTYLTTLMLLDNFATDYLNQRNFTVNQMISDYENVLSYLGKSKELYSILQSEELIEKKEDFKNWILDALNHYKVQNQEVIEMAQSYEELGFLRRDALRSMEQLEVHQFYQGAEDSLETPKYVTEVQEFWNINSLIRAMQSDNTLSGISLNLIRDPLNTSSYFVFGIKNGETLSILTDKPKYGNPLEKYRSRRPGRDMSERIFKNHFPYDLLDISFTQEGDAYIKPKNSKELTMYQEELRPLKMIKDLEPDEVIWIIMMFSLIKERFWDKGFRTKELSYTGEMTYNKEVLIENRNLVNVNEYKQLEIKPLKKSDITSVTLKNDWDTTPTEKNKWLENRYQEKVQESYLNLIGNDREILFLTSGNELLTLTQEEYKEKTNFMSMRSGFKGKALAKFDTSMFGSKEDIEKTKKWIARYNQAIVIKTEAEKEFEARKNEVLDFVDRKIEENKEKLLKAIGLGVFEAPVHPRQELSFGHSSETVIENILRIKLEDERRFSDMFGSRKLYKLVDDNKYACYLTGSKATLVAIFRPQTAEAVALLCGCKVEELPDVLQHWTTADFYSGNDLLRNIDPMEWVVENPWKELNLNVEVYLSKSSYNELCKNIGEKPNKFWLNSK